MLEGFLGREYFNNTVYDYLTSLALFAGAYIIIRIFKAVILRRIRKIAAKTSTEIDDFLIDSFTSKFLPIFYFLAFYISIDKLDFNESVQGWIKTIVVIAVVIMGVRFMAALLSYAIKTVWKKREMGEEGKEVPGALMTISRIILWTVAVVIILDNLGVKITALVTGLGIGGVAIAIAAQAVLTDLFSYFTIFFDRPFEIGDFVIVDDFMGTVEHIGIKTSRIRSLGGEELVFSNTDLTSSRLKNYKTMDTRRVLFKLGVTYDTGLERLKEIPGIIREVIDSVECTRFDRSHFQSYGDFSLIYETVYYILDRDYNRYMEIQHQINLYIKEEFEKRGIEFAFPTQTIHLSGGEGD